MDRRDEWHSRLTDEEYAQQVAISPEITSAAVQAVFRKRLLATLKNPPPDMHQQAMEAFTSIEEWPADFGPSDMSLMIESLGEGSSKRHRRVLAYAATIRQMRAVLTDEFNPPGGDDDDPLATGNE